ncbi:MAG TPA: hypothetical protein VN047_09500 [Sphingopyxis sp.]|uniref:hypothetical protein n=1 Tax=Sphingopyxis sp. TaxID=1908224 RepID=UPI002B96F7DA|nr:hypothetical protein [Sphingopyxis sp.]HWW57113.1 hypothetical protein [Sphingopyxis sp.]
MPTKRYLVDKYEDLKSGGGKNCASQHFRRGSPAAKPVRRRIHPKRIDRGFFPCKWVFSSFGNLVLLEWLLSGGSK